MFGLGFQELLVIGILALLILGPKKLPELARTVGKVVREFQRAADDMKKEINAAALEDEPLGKAHSPKPAASDPSARAYGLEPEPNPLEAVAENPECGAAGTSGHDGAAPQAAAEAKLAGAPDRAAGENKDQKPSPHAG
jgi:Tat protein translocase TatB subunit